MRTPVPTKYGSLSNLSVGAGPRPARGRTLCAPTEKKERTVNVLWEKESPRRFAAPPLTRVGFDGRGTPQGGFSCPFGAIHLQPLPYMLQEKLPDLGRGGPWSSRCQRTLYRWFGRSRRECGAAPFKISHKARAQWPGRNCRAPLRFCAPEILHPVKGITPVMGVLGGGDHGKAESDWPHPLALFW